VPVAPCNAVIRPVTTRETTAVPVTACKTHFVRIAARWTTIGIVARRLPEVRLTAHE
jgi:hypothetical protein